MSTADTKQAKLSDLRRQATAAQENADRAASSIARHLDLKFPTGDPALDQLIVAWRNHHNDWAEQLEKYFHARHEADDVTTGGDDGGPDCGA